MDANGGARRRCILFLTPQMPYPPEQGGALRNYNLIMQVARRHDVGLLSFVEGAAGDPGPLSDVCSPLITVPAPTRTVLDRVGTLAMTGAPDMARRLQSSAYAHTLRGLLTKESFGIVQIEGIELAPYAWLIRKWFPDRPPALVYDAHNAEFLLQRRAFATDIRNPSRLATAIYSWIQWRRLERFETRVLRAADGRIAVSRADAQALKEMAPLSEVLVVPNGVDVARYTPDLVDSIPLRHPAIVYTGKMSFRPNVDAMVWFHKHVWPRVHAGVPEATLYVVGKEPHSRLDPLVADPSVVVTGYVKDVLPYFGGADVYVVPLRIGGGTRLKVLEAMAAGLPVVSTTMGAEGIVLEPGRHALLADEADDFAAAIEHLLANRKRRQALGDSARENVLENYDWQRIAPRLEPLYASL